MLRDVLATNRLFAVAGVDPRQCGVPGQIDPPHRVATVGIVRACQKTDDGTSNVSGNFSPA
jgi:ATP-dependent Lon protease